MEWLLHHVLRSHGFSWFNPRPQFSLQVSTTCTVWETSIMRIFWLDRNRFSETAAGSFGTCIELVVHKVLHPCMSETEGTSIVKDIATPFQNPQSFQSHEDVIQKDHEQNALCSKIWDVVPFCKSGTLVPLETSTEDWLTLVQGILNSIFIIKGALAKCGKYNLGPPKIAKLAYKSKNYGSVHYTYNLLYNYCYRGF